MYNIQNWNELTDEQKQIAKEQFAFVLKQDNKEISDYFKEHSYVVIRNVISQEMANLLYNYVKNESQLLATYESYDNEKLLSGFSGTFSDAQAPGDFSKYGDLIFDTLLTDLNLKMEAYTDMSLTSTYSYHRLYTTDTQLVRHKDRPSCEISTTLCLGYDSDYNWPMFVKTENEEIPIELNPGDMIIYKGCEIEHWREPFKGKNHAQVFLHYNDKDGPYKNTYDGRPFIGMPASFKDVHNALKNLDSNNFKFSKVID